MRAALLLGAAGCLFLPEVAAGLLPQGLRAALVAAGLFLVPGMIVARVLGGHSDFDWRERPALWFVLSLAAQLPAFGAVLVLGGALAHGPSLLLAGLTALTLLDSYRRRDARGATTTLEAPVATGLTVLTILIVIATTGYAWLLTSTGSTDRWWYLAYVRGYIDAPSLDLAEPLLGTGRIQPRFELNIWLLTFALWAKLAGAAPLWLYDRACALLLVPLAFSASFLLARRLFRDLRLATLAALAAGLLWMSGSILPVVARLPEDKLLASAVVAPVVMGLLIDLARSASLTGALAAIAATSVLATVHPLATALTALVITPLIVLWAGLRLTRIAPAAVALAIVVAGMAYPLHTGSAAREALRAQGATLAQPDHPVVRVHRGRGRLIELSSGSASAQSDGSYMVDPRLLADPLLVLALVALACAFKRPLRERCFLVPATVIPLLLAFVPALATTLGGFVLPWMVYRVLWAIPFALLLAIAAEMAWSRSARQGWLVIALMVALATPGTARSLTARVSSGRAERNAPDPATLGPVLAALSGLPDSVIVAASPLLSERIPALTGKNVLAISDRGTFVFAGSREEAEQRLRSRAAIYAGLWKPAPPAPAPTHLLVHAPSPAQRYCGAIVAQTETVALCAFDPIAPEAGVRLSRARTAVAGDSDESLASMLGAGTSVLHATCEPSPRLGTSLIAWRPQGPWAANAASARCLVEPRAGSGARLRPAGLLVRAAAGAARDELTVAVRGLLAGAQRWNLRTREPLAAGEDLWFTLPTAEVDRIEITLAPSFLPYLLLADLRMIFTHGDDGGPSQ